MFVLFILFILVIIILQNTQRRVVETFKPHNAFEFKEDNILTIYDKESKNVQKTLDTKNTTSTLPNFKTNFEKFYYYETFIFSPFLINYLTDYLQKLFPKREIKIVREINEIYYHDKEHDKRDFVFQINVIDKKKFFARVMFVHMTLHNLGRYLLDNGEYDPRKSQLNTSDIEIHRIELKIDPKLTYNARDPRPESNMYRITNSLYLLEPYKTNRLIITEDELEEYKDQLRRNRQPLGEEFFARRTGKCFTSETGEPNELSTKKDCLLNGDTWDLLPSKNYECPYYRQNKNYPNNFGKLVGDYCEMPKNMKRTGFKITSINPKFAPLCYNCQSDKIMQGTLGYCCTEQNNRDKYPTLRGPDYAFPGDQKLRSKYSDLLIQKGLSVN